MNTICPVCSLDLNQAVSIDGRPPEVGDMTICVYCCSILVFGKKKFTVYKTANELDAGEKALIQDRVNMFKQVMNRDNN